MPASVRIVHNVILSAGASRYNTLADQKCAAVNCNLRGVRHRSLANRDDCCRVVSQTAEPENMARLWVDYVGELAREAGKNPDGKATVVAIGIHPFVMGTPDGAAALRRTLETLKKEPTVWLTDVEAVVHASDSQAE